MSLSLDARQRAMLQEMGVTVWAPAEAAAAVPAAAPPARSASAPEGAAKAVPSPVAAAPVPAAQPPRTSPPAPVAQRAPAPAPASTPAAMAAGSVAAGSLSLHAPRALYPTADPARTPAGLGSGWLIAAEVPDPAEPLAGDAGKLLDNMLRAMQLHRHPRVFLAALERTAPGGSDADVAGQLAQAVAMLQPAMVLVLGHVAARAALASTEPLGRLRAGPHTLAGCPAVVTYDPAFLLRSQDNKAAAWADLCRALATVRAATTA